MSEELLDDNVTGYVDIDNEPQQKKGPYALRYGFIAALLGIIYSLFLFFIGQDLNRTLSSLGLIIAIVLVVVAMKSFKKDNYNRLTGRQGFGLGLLFFLVFAVLSTAFFFLYIELINPDFQAQMMDIQEERLENRGYSDEMIEQQMKYVALFMKPAILSVVSVLQIMFAGLIVSGIAALVLRSPARKNT
jgi:hypothetical protein